MHFPTFSIVAAVASAALSHAFELPNIPGYHAIIHDDPNKYEDENSANAAEQAKELKYTRSEPVKHEIDWDWYHNMEKLQARGIEVEEYVTYSHSAHHYDLDQRSADPLSRLTGHAPAVEHSVPSGSSAVTQQEEADLHRLAGHGPVVREPLSHLAARQLVYDTEFDMDKDSEDQHYERHLACSADPLIRVAGHAEAVEHLYDNEEVIPLMARSIDWDRYSTKHEGPKPEQYQHHDSQHLHARDANLDGHTEAMASAMAKDYASQFAHHGYAPSPVPSRTWPITHSTESHGHLTESPTAHPSFHPLMGRGFMPNPASSSGSATTSPEGISALIASMSKAFAASKSAKETEHFVMPSETWATATSGSTKSWEQPAEGRMNDALAKHGVYARSDNNDERNKQAYEIKNMRLPTVPVPAKTGTSSTVSETGKRGSFNFGW